MVIINYEQVGKYRSNIDAVQWDLLVVDEAHYVKNNKADRTANILGRWVKDDPQKTINPIRAKRRLFMTGTPILNRPIELWTLVHALDRKGLGANWRAFAQRYCGGHQGRFGWDTTGASNLDELQAKLRASVMVRRMKADVLTELPAKRRSVIAFQPLSAAERAAVEHETQVVRATEDKLAKLRARVEETRTWSDPAAYKRAVEELSQGNMAAFTETSKVRHEVALAKLPQVIAHVRDCLENEDKVVVFAHHHDVIDQLAEALAEFFAVKFDGRMTLPDREMSQLVVSNQQQRPHIRRRHPGGWRGHHPHRRLSCRLRVNWIGFRAISRRLKIAAIASARPNSVLVQHLVLDGSLDARMAQIIVEKMDIIAAAVDDKAADGALAAPKLYAPIPALPRPNTPNGDLPKPTGGNGAQPGDLPQPQIEAIHRALQIISGLCDGAQALDGYGFNKLDTEFGHSLAARELLTQKQARYGRTLAIKYGRQLDPASCWRS